MVPIFYILCNLGTRELEEKDTRCIYVIKTAQTILLFPFLSLVCLACVACCVKTPMCAPITLFVKPINKSAAKSFNTCKLAMNGTDHQKALRGKIIDAILFFKI